MMKIVTYNVNGLRPRISQHGSLAKLLDSFGADVVCLQETKLRRSELTSDLAMADGYESFFSCTRTSQRGRAGYSGVATFCRAKSAFSSEEAALPVAAEEGFTGVLSESSRPSAAVALGLEEFESDELLKVDGEGRCVVTDHGHFVLFNVYGPRATPDDSERIEFKMKFFKIMQKRWESFLSQGRRVLVVGDLNIAPTYLDRCEAGPDFETNEFRRWFRSMLIDNGGSFFDVFRATHPDRRDAYTCWSQSTGAEEFNFGSRIDHILCAGSCLHQEHDNENHSFFACHISECDILTQYKRWKPGNNSLRWKEGHRVKLEGSDHAPVYASLLQIPSVPQHNTPPLSARYIPMIYGIQQTLVSTLMKRQVTTHIKSTEVGSSLLNEDIAPESLPEGMNKSLNEIVTPDLSSSSQISEILISRGDKVSGSRSVYIGAMPGNDSKKKAKKNQWSQLTLKSYFLANDNNGGDGSKTSKADRLESSHEANDSPICNRQSEIISQSDSPQPSELNCSASTPDQDKVDTHSFEKNSVALQEWQRIQQMMQNSIPLCKGHKEPCVTRVVKKQGQNFGRRFYVCSRAEGPSSNLEANCGYFQWAASKSRGK